MSGVPALELLKIRIGLLHLEASLFRRVVMVAEREHVEAFSRTVSRRRSNVCETEL